MDREKQRGRGFYGKEVDLALMLRLVEKKTGFCVCVCVCASPSDVCVCIRLSCRVSEFQVGSLFDSSNVLQSPRAPLRHHGPRSQVKPQRAGETRIPVHLQQSWDEEEGLKRVSCNGEDRRGAVGGGRGRGHGSEQEAAEDENREISPSLIKASV